MIFFFFTKVGKDINQRFDKTSKSQLVKLFTIVYGAYNMFKMSY